MFQTYVVWLASSLLIGLVCAGIAKKKGRNPLYWFFIGATANIIALALIFNISNKRKRGISQ